MALYSGSTFWIESSFRLATADEISRQRAENVPDDGPLTEIIPSPTPPLSISKASQERPNLHPAPPSTATTTTRVGTPSPQQKDRLLRDSQDGPERKLADTEEEEKQQQPPPTLDRVKSDPVANGITTPNGHELVKADTVPLLTTAVPVVEGITKQEPPPNASTEPDAPLRVLVVDDDQLTRTLMTRMLTRLGCTVETASDGQEALDILLGGVSAEHPMGTQPRYFDLVSLDNAMPVMTGETAVKRLRALGRKDFIVGCVGLFKRTTRRGKC